MIIENQEYLKSLLNMPILIYSDIIFTRKKYRHIQLNLLCENNLQNSEKNKNSLLLNFNINKNTRLLHKYFTSIKWGFISYYICISPNLAISHLATPQPNIFQPPKVIKRYAPSHSNSPRPHFIDLVPYSSCFSNFSSSIHL